MLQKSPPSELSLKQILAIPVFGPADYFPMLAEDELQELADDIKAMANASRSWLAKSLEMMAP